MKVRFKKLSPNAVMPTKAHPSDAGADIVCTGFEVDDDGNVVCHSGIAVEIPEGYCGFLFPRSSIAKKDLALSNAVGVIDCHYRGEVTAKFKPTEPTKHEKRHIYHAGERMAQLIVLPYPEVEYVESNELSDTDRGKGGYGSTGN